MNDQIILKGCRQHNLKNFSLTLPKQKLIVITGVSGSGKSSLAWMSQPPGCWDYRPRASLLVGDDQGRDYTRGGNAFLGQLPPGAPPSLIPNFPP